MEFLRQNTAATIVIQLIDWGDGKTMPLSITLTDLKCTVYKNGAGSILELSSGGSNAFNLSGLADGMATLTLTDADTDTAGRLKIVISNAITGEIESDAILRSVTEFSVLSEIYFDALFSGGSVLTDTDKSDIVDGVEAMANGSMDDYGSVWNKIAEMWNQFFPTAELSNNVTVPIAATESAQAGAESDMIDVLADGEFSTAVVYTIAATGIAKTINAVKMPTEESYEINDGGTGTEIRSVWFISANPDAGIATPAMKDTIVDGSETYEVISADIKDRIFAKLVCRRIRTLKRMNRNQIGGNE